MVKHKHHIIPKHMGGTDDPSNLIELTVEEHAEAHRVLFEKYGRWQDELAWKGLSGQIDSAEINYIKSVIMNTGENNPMYGKEGYMRGKKHTEEAKKKIKEKRAKQKIIHSEETKKKIGLKHKGKVIPEQTRLAVSEANKKRLGKKFDKHYSNKGIKLDIVTCPHCGKEGGGSAMKQWHFNNCKLKGNNNE